jgi:hypothetical protein
MVADNKFRPYYKLEKGHVKIGNPCLENVISGKLQYLKMVKGDDDSVYMVLKLRFDSLTNTLSRDSLDSSQFTYISTMSVKQFEESMQTKIESDVSKGGKNYYYFVSEGKRTLIQASASAKDTKSISDLSISYCEGKSDNKRFYLLHKPICQSIEITSDNKSEELDKLLFELVDSDFNLEKLLAYGTE